MRHRRSIRLRQYDYAEAGAYFLTICTYHRECLFGDVIDGEMHLNQWGDLVRDEWLRTAVLKPHIRLDTLMIMPNHVHGVVWIRGEGTARRAPTIGRFGALIAGSLATIVGAFKSACTRRINEMRNTPTLPVWQRNYFEHVVRNEAELLRIREYIASNPVRWAEDVNNPASQLDVQPRSEFDEIFVGARRAVPSGSRISTATRR
jgi:REP element-mobilizing transposase RayT